MFSAKLLFVFLTTYIALVATRNINSAENKCNLTSELKAEIKSYQTIVNRIAAAAFNGSFTGNTWRRLAAFTDTFGGRMSGSQNLEDSIDYLVQRMKEMGLDNVHTESANVPNWKRGNEQAVIILPRKRQLPVLGFGGTVGTPREGILANVIVLETLQELIRIGRTKVRGNIVVMVPSWEIYMGTAEYRRRAVTLAAQFGARAVLMRALTTFSIGTLHTSWLKYTENVRKVPAGAITIEDAERLLRQYKRGEAITIRLELEDRNLGEFVSRNVIAELKGQTAQPVVVLSGHIDSWDVGVGAMDDGGGAFISWKALQLIKSLGLKVPRRTLRAILWTGEEQGVWGARAYAEQHKANETAEFNFFMESDMGTFVPFGFDFSGNEEATCIFHEIVKLMAPLNVTDFRTPLDTAPDIQQYARRGFPSASLLTKNDNYYWFHHSAGDSMLVEDTHSLDKNCALFAAVGYVIADLSIDLPKNIVPL